MAGGRGNNKRGTQRGGGRGSGRGGDRKPDKSVDVAQLLAPVTSMATGATTANPLLLGGAMNPLGAMGGDANSQLAMMQMLGGLGSTGTTGGAMSVKMTPYQMVGFQQMAMQHQQQQAAAVEEKRREEIKAAVLKDREIQAAREPTPKITLFDSEEGATDDDVGTLAEETEQLSKSQLRRRKKQEEQARKAEEQQQQMKELADRVEKAEGKLEVFKKAAEAEHQEAQQDLGRTRSNSVYGTADSPAKNRLLMAYEEVKRKGGGLSVRFEEGKALAQSQGGLVITTTAPKGVLKSTKHTQYASHVDTDSESIPTSVDTGRPLRSSRKRTGDAGIVTPISGGTSSKDQIAMLAARKKKVKSAAPMTNEQRAIAFVMMVKECAAECAGPPDADMFKEVQGEYADDAKTYLAIVDASKDKSQRRTELGEGLGNRKFPLERASGEKWLTYIARIIYTLEYNEVELQSHESFSEIVLK